MARSKTFKVGRDSKSGQFISVKAAERRKSTAAVERIPKAGHRSTKIIADISKKHSKSLRRLAKR